MTRGVCRRLPKSLAELQRGAARPQAKHETAAGEVVCVCVCAWAAGQSWCGCIRDTAETLVLTNLIYEISDCAAELLTPFGSTPGCGGSTESSSKDSDSIRVTDPCELCLIFMHRCEPESLPNANGPCGVQHGKHHINIYARFNASWMRESAPARLGFSEQETTAENVRLTNFVPPFRNDRLMSAPIFKKLLSQPLMLCWSAPWTPTEPRPRTSL